MFVSKYIFEKQQIRLSIYFQFKWAFISRFFKSKYILKMNWTESIESSFSKIL